MKLGLNGVGSNSNGLILWENDATRLRIIFRLDFWPPGAQKIKKIPSLLSADAGIYGICFANVPTHVLLDLIS